MAPGAPPPLALFGVRPVRHFGAIRTAYASYAPPPLALFGVRPVRHIRALSHSSASDAPLALFRVRLHHETSSLCVSPLRLWAIRGFRLKAETTYSLQPRPQ